MKHCCSAAAAYKDARIVGDHAQHTTYDPTLPPRQSLEAARSSKKVSLLEGESGLTPAAKTPPTRYKLATACFPACLAEAARGTEDVVRLTGKQMTVRKLQYFQTYLNMKLSYGVINISLGKLLVPFDHLQKVNQQLTHTKPIKNGILAYEDYHTYQIVGSRCNLIGRELGVPSGC